MSIQYQLASGCCLTQAVYPLPVDFDGIWGLGKYQARPIRSIYGKKVRVPRTSCNYGSAYDHSGESHAGGECPDVLLPLKVWANRYAERMGEQPFDNMVLNLYDNGGDYISRHKDDEPQIRPGSCILSVSFGETRTFRLRNNGAIVLDVPMNDGCVLVMHGPMFQSTLTHEVPKVSGAKGAALGRRINVTFRQFVKTP